MGLFRNIPPVTKAILYANIAAFVLINLMLAGTPASLQSMFEVFGLVPALFWKQGYFWQPLTSMFMHGSFIHILANMIGVWSIGTFLERSLGSAKYGWLYFISGLTGALFVIGGQFLDGSWADGRPTVGASGALLGLLGAIAVLTPNSRLLIFIFPVKARTAAIGIGLISLFFSIYDTGGIISHLGHLGGLVGGLIYTWLALAPELKHGRMHDRMASGGGFFGGAGGPFGGEPNSGGPFGGGGRTTARDEQVARLMEEMMRRMQGGSPGRSPYSSGGRGEKVINPRPDDVSGERTYDEPPRPSGGGRKIVYYDPVSGRFYVKEV